MKNIAFITFLFFSIFLSAQDTPNIENVGFEKSIIYKASVEGLLYKPNYKGYLYELNDSTITMKKSLELDEYYEISPEHVMRISFRKKGRNFWKGLGLGALSGFVVGSLVGTVSGPSPSSDIFQFTAGDKAVILGVGLTPIGAIIGGIIGHRKIKIPIYGDRKNYLRQKKELKKYTIKQGF